jgi:hypothetical protein
MESSYSAYAIAGSVILVIVTSLYIIAYRMKNNQKLKLLEDEARQQQELIDRINRVRDQPII